jgi:hypothetical protein
MDPGTSRVTAAHTRVVIFDHAAARNCSLGLHERIAACFRLASLNGWQVEEVCGTDTDAGSVADELDRALAICEHLDARLLTYDELWLIAEQLLDARVRGTGLLTVRQKAAVS